MLRYNFGGSELGPGTWPQPESKPDGTSEEENRGDQPDTGVDSLYEGDIDEI